MSGAYSYIELVAAGQGAIGLVRSGVEREFSAETSVAMLADQTRAVRTVLGADSSVVGVHRTDEWHQPSGSDAREPDIRIYVGEHACQHASAINELLGADETTSDTGTVLLPFDGQTAPPHEADAHILMPLGQSPESAAEAIRGMLCSLFMPSLISFDIIDLLDCLPVGEIGLFSSGSADGPNSPAQATESVMQALGLPADGVHLRSALLLLGVGGETTLGEMNDAYDRLAEADADSVLVAGWCEPGKTLETTAYAYVVKA